MKAMQDKVVVSGGAGFIGSNLIKSLNRKGLQNIIVVDHLAHNKSKRSNLINLKYQTYFDRDEFLKQIQANTIGGIEIIVHLGARTDTTEKNKNFLIENNTVYSQKLFNFCLRNGCRFIYASSAATYGDGSHGYSDQERDLKPLNYYGLSKYLFDEWILNRKEKTPQWVGLKFFNVYGPNEYHKGLMASVIYHGFQEIMKNGRIRLFKSYNKNYRDGEQKRDFIYVKDAVKIILFFLNRNNLNGIYNVGTGKARSFLELANALFQALNQKPRIDFIDMPKEIKERYQYFTEANIDSLWQAGFKEEFYELEDGIFDYVKNYLL